MPNQSLTAKPPTSAHRLRQSRNRPDRRPSYNRPPVVSPAAEVEKATIQAIIDDRTRRHQPSAA